MRDLLRRVLRDQRGAAEHKFLTDWLKSRERDRLEGRFICSTRTLHRLILHVLGIRKHDPGIAGPPGEQEMALSWQWANRAPFHIKHKMRVFLWRWHDKNRETQAVRELHRAELTLLTIDPQLDFMAPMKRPFFGGVDPSGSMDYVWPPHCQKRSPDRGTPDDFDWSEMYKELSARDPSGEPVVFVITDGSGEDPEEGETH
jgi:hypothetical protein